MSRIYRCTKTIISDFQGGTVVFTKDRLYEGFTSATPGGDWAMQFTNDLNEPHLMTADWLRGYFARVEEAEKEADREAERQELWQPGDEPYEPDYWGAHYE